MPFQRGYPDCIFYYLSQWNELLTGTKHLEDYNNRVLKPLYEQTNITLGRELRDTTEQHHGNWSIRRPHGEYDTHNIPTGGGILIIERPWILDDAPYRVGFIGPTRPTEQEVTTYLDYLLQHMHQRVMDYAPSGKRRRYQEALDTLLTSSGTHPDSSTHS